MVLNFKGSWFNILQSWCLWPGFHYIFHYWFTNWLWHWIKGRISPLIIMLLLCTKCDFWLFIGDAIWYSFGVVTSHMEILNSACIYLALPKQMPCWDEVVTPCSRLHNLAICTKLIYWVSPANCLFVISLFPLSLTEYSQVESVMFHSFH